MLVGQLRQAERAVDVVVVVADVAGLAGDLVAKGHPVELAVADVDVVDVADGVEGDDERAVLRLAAGDVLDIDVAHGRVVAAAADLVVLVVEVDLHHGLGALAHLDIAHVDIFDDTATAGVGFDAEHAVEVWRVHHAVVRVDVLAATRDFRADDDTAVAVLHLTVADDDVLRRHVTLAAVAVASALDGDAVVAGVEEAVLDQYAVAALRVAAITVGAVVDHLDTADGDVGRV